MTDRWGGDANVDGYRFSLHDSLNYLDLTVLYRPSTGRGVLRLLHDQSCKLLH